MSDFKKPGRFSPGRLIATPGVLDAVPRGELYAALDRHLACDWGDVSERDARRNDRALADRERLFSAYHANNKTKFWIITEADRSSTTVLLPSEY